MRTPPRAGATIAPRRPIQAWHKGGFLDAATPPVPDGTALGADPPPRPAVPARTAEAAADGGAGERQARLLRLLLPAAVALPLLVLAAGLWLSWRQTWQEAQAGTARAADAAAGYARRLLDGQRLRIALAGELIGGLSDAEIRAREPELHAALRRATADHASAAPAPEAAAPEAAGRAAGVSVFVYDRNGLPLLSSVVPAVPRDRPHLDPEFVAALRAAAPGEVRIGRVHLGRDTGRHFFSVARRREGAGDDRPDGAAFAGFIAASAYSDAVAAALRRLAPDEADGVALIGADGTVLARSGGFAPGVAAPRLEPGSPELAAMRRGEERGALTGRMTSDGAERIAAFRRVEGWPVHAWAVRERAAVLARWRAPALRQAGLGLAATALLAALALLVRRRRDRLAAAAEALLRGGRDRQLAAAAALDRRGRDEPAAAAEVLERRRRDELAAAAEVLERRRRDELAAVAEAALDQRRRDELAAANAALERRAAERAAALAASERRNREILDSLGDLLLYALDRDGRVRFANRRLLDAWGRREEEVLGRHLLDLFPHVADSVAWEVVQRGIRRREEVHVCAVSPVLGRWTEIVVHPAEGGGVTIAVRDMHDRRTGERERRRAEAAVREGEARLRDLLATLDLTAVMARDLGGTIRFWSAGCQRLYGWAAEEAVGRSAHALLATAFPVPLAEVEATLLREGEWRGDLRQRRRDGAELVVAAHKTLRRDGTGRPVAVAESLTDVTALRRAEERQALLSRELDHRAKNALAVVQAAVRLTPKDDPAAFARAVEGRVAALARAHTLLARGRWQGAPLRELVEAELAAFLVPVGGGRAAGAGGAGAGAGEGRVTVEGPSLMLAPAAAQALSMALHELATNAMKYGALSVPEGRVAVSWAVEEGAAGVLRLSWEERGGPPVTAPPTRRGFGSRVIEATLRDQLGGQVQRRWEATGLRVECEIPLARLRPSQPPGGAQRNPGRRVGAVGAIG